MIKNINKCISIPLSFGEGLVGVKFLFLLFLLLSCTDKKGGNTFPSGELQSITLGMMPSMDGLPFIIAQRQGIYDSLDIEVNFVRYNSSTDRDNAFQSGAIDGTITDLTTAITQQAKGIRLGMIMKNDGYFCLITEKESDIKEVSQLKGKNIAVSHGTVIDYATDLVLAKVGITPQEVNKPEINNLPLRYVMLENRQVVASFFPDPYATMAKNNGHKSLISTQTLGSSFTGTVFSEKALKEKSEEIKRLVTGYNLGVAYIRSHPLKEWKQILAEEMSIPETLTRLLVLPSYKPATRPDSLDIAKAITWLKSKGAIPQTYKETHLVDTTYTSTYLKPQ